MDKSLLRALWRTKYVAIILLMLGTWEATQSFSHAKLLVPLYLWGIPIQGAALVAVLLWNRWREGKVKSVNERVIDGR